MRAALAVLATIVIAPPALCAEAPFVPPGVTPPDYVATVVEKDAYTKDRSWIIMHHGDWSRVSARPERSEYAVYFAANGVRIAASPTSISISRPSRYDHIMDYEPRNTGERQTYLDETCTVWEIERPKSGPAGSTTTALLNGSATRRLSCVTDDGIELWQKRDYQTSTSSQEATHIERRPIIPEDSAPPPRLVLDWWDKNAPSPAASDVPDHEVVMKLPPEDSRAEASLRTERRSGAWQRIDETLGARRGISIIHELAQFRFSFSMDETGRPQGLQITTPAAPIEPAALAKGTGRREPKQLDRSETVLNESCSWFDLTPGMADAGKTACLTQDRVALKEGLYSRTDRREWTAVRIARRPVAPDEVKPPAELLDPQTWLQ